MTQQSSKSIPAGSKEMDVLLPAYLIRQQGGVFVDLSHFPVGGGFAEFLDRMFGEGARFAGLDYGLLSGLLYDYDTILDTHGIGTKAKLAVDVVEFPPLRRALYKAVKVDAESKRAEYLFEPVQIEVEVEVPVYGQPGADGVAPITSTARQKVLQPAQLDIDEFIADMWLKGVRYGMAVEAVAEVIASGETVRIDIAYALEATEGSDAEIEEASDVLRRDNSPKRLANGKADLRKFQNRFPQISRNSRLLKKKKRVLGKPGFKVSGVVIEPPISADFDLNALAGDGTRVENQGANEYIVASRDGFLSLDIVTNRIDVTEKIENKGGVSVKTTGDLSLSGDEFIEHGEVQEGRVVEGKNMTFRSDVYGDIVSQDGFILLEANLSSGSARSFGGDVTANNHAFNSIIEAWEGRVTVKYAESCLILGESVEIERAVNCEIIAENIQVGVAQGCAVAGKVIKIGSSSSCRGKESIVSMLVPGLANIDAQINQVKKAIAEGEILTKTQEQELALKEADNEIVQYLALEKSIRQGSVKLSAAQQENWQRLSARVAGIIAAMDKLKADRQEQLKRIAAFRQELEYLLKAREKSGTGIHCKITEITGDTLVRTMVAYNGFIAFQKSSASELRIKLREQGLPQERVFLNDEGNLDWCYELPEIAQ